MARGIGCISRIFQYEIKKIKLSISSSKCAKKDTGLSPVSFLFINVRKVVLGTNENLWVSNDGIARLEPLPMDIELKAGEHYIKIKENGDFLRNGEIVETNQEVYNAFVSFLQSAGHLHTENKYFQKGEWITNGDMVFLVEGMSAKNHAYVKFNLDDPFDHVINIAGFRKATKEEVEINLRKLTFGKYGRTLNQFKVGDAGKTFDGRLIEIVKVEGPYVFSYTDTRFLASSITPVYFVEDRVGKCDE